MSKEESLLDHLREFSEKHRDDEWAAWAVMSFLRGECAHYGAGKTCEVCGAELGR